MCHIFFSTLIGRYTCWTHDKNRIAFGNQLESSGGGGVSETEMNVPEAGFYPHKIIQVDYHEK